MTNVGRDLSMKPRTFAAKNLRASISRVTIRRKLASMRVGTQRRRSAGSSSKMGGSYWHPARTFVELSRRESGWSISNMRSSD
jgi:hypothetical protein